MDDEIIFNEGSVMITKTLARFGDTSYPVNGIGSVSIDPPRRGLVIFLAIALGLFILLIFAGGADHLRDTMPILMPMIFLDVLLVLAAASRPYRLKLRTASGDQTAMTATSTTNLQRIKVAIEQAVAKRG